MRSPLRLRLAAAVLPWALLPLGACGVVETLRAGMPGNATTEQGATDAVSAAPVAPGERVPPKKFRQVLAAGAKATTTARLAMTSTGGPAPFSGVGDVDYRTEPPSSAMTMSVGRQKIETRMVDGSVYMKIPGATGGRFVAFGLRDPGNPLGPDFAAGTDATRQLEALTKALREVVYEGQKFVGGEELDHYRMTVDPRQTTQTLGQKSRPGVAGLPKNLTYDLFLDVKQRVRRMAMDLGRAGSFELRLERYGKDVDIAKPRPGTVLSSSRLGGS